MTEDGFVSWNAPLNVAGFVERFSSTIGFVVPPGTAACTPFAQAQGAAEAAMPAAPACAVPGGIGGVWCGGQASKAEAVAHHVIGRSGAGPAKLHA